MTVQIHVPEEKFVDSTLKLFDVILFVSSVLGLSVALVVGGLLFATMILRVITVDNGLIRALISWIKWKIIIILCQEK